MRRVLGASSRPHGIDAPPAWMVAAAREVGPSVVDAQGVTVGGIAVRDIRALNEVADAQNAAARQGLDHATDEISAFLARQWERPDEP
ncbi:MAG TPA: hypothetical protein VLG11_04400 [Candidatus Saccharimonadales bacterium]|nr:hypothetical protein [Candidatus Saccharimonadales bacterium]